jgi:GNAT superfamily N-acetyltransferase
MTDTAHAIEISLHDEVPREEGVLVDAGLGESNAAAAPLDEVRGLSCFARLPSGQAIGGAVGRTWGQCCELQQLWVDPAHRGKGLGTRLVKAFEGRARNRGCRTFYLETFSFQAPSLYRALDYEARLELHGFPGNIAKYVMVRECAADEGTR